jgi:hypothetical protein
MTFAGLFAVQNSNGRLVRLCVASINLDRNPAEIAIQRRIEPLLLQNRRPYIHAIENEKGPVGDPINNQIAVVILDAGNARSGNSKSREI